MMRIAVGDTAQRTKTFTQQEVEAYIQITGDQNPLHTRQSGENRFEKPIVHGMLLAGLVSAVIGTQLPGPGAVYVSQEVRFIRPVFIGDTVSVTCKVTRLLPESQTAHLRSMLYNQANQLVCSAHSAVLLPQE